MLNRAWVLAALLGCATTDPIDTSPGGSGESGGADSTTSSEGGAPGVGGDGDGAGDDGMGGDGGQGGDGGGAPACGDGAVGVGEECDDANVVADDGCTTCTIDCEAPALRDPATGHCYQRFDVVSNRMNAEAACQAWGGAPGLGHLASITDAVENAFLDQFATTNTWIGADDFGGDWAWIDGTPFAFENWQDGEPNHPGTEHCLFMDIEAKWHDHDCADLRPGYVCERRGAGTF